MTGPLRTTVALAAAVALALSAGCGDGGGDPPEPRAPEASVPPAVDERAAVDTALHRIETTADSVRSRLRRVPALARAELPLLRRYLNRAHLARARRLGIERGADAERLAALREEGLLVELEPETRWWIVRELDHSVPLVTPDTRRLLVDLGESFHARLDSLGLPPYRFEVTSVLRTMENQAALRRINPNATRGASAHEFGTTVDVAYNDFSPPAEPLVDFPPQVPERLEEPLALMARGAAEAAAGEHLLRLQALLGRALRDLQAEGRVVVTRERAQPVFHFTVASAEGGGGTANARR